MDCKALFDQEAEYVSCTLAQHAGLCADWAGLPTNLMIYNLFKTEGNAKQTRPSTISVLRTSLLGFLP
jgi:hypothetical protein